MLGILGQRYRLRGIRTVARNPIDVDQLSTGNHAVLQGPFQDKAAKIIHLLLFTNTLTEGCVAAIGPSFSIRPQIENKSKTNRKSMR